MSHEGGVHRQNAGSAFVIMPFDGTFDDLHRRAIRPALAAFDLGAERYDDVPKAGTVLEEMCHSIDRARLVIAVVTGKNPHVFLELGLTLARGKPCILLAGSADDVPDFLKHLPHVVYGGSADAALRGLTEQITGLVGRPGGGGGATRP